MKYIQLSLFDTDMRSVSDDELIQNLTNKNRVEDVELSGYRMETLFNRLTPQRRRIAVSAVELYRRRELRIRDAAAIKCSHDIYCLMKPLIADLPNEEFWIIMLSRSGKVIKKVRVSVGGIDQTSADIRLIMRLLIEAGSVQFIAAHNHPSGTLHPSGIDEKLTSSLKNAAELFNIKLIDHLIVSGEGYYSFSDEGTL